MSYSDDFIVIPANSGAHAKIRRPDGSCEDVPIIAWGIPKDEGWDGTAWVVGSAGGDMMWTLSDYCIDEEGNAVVERIVA